MHVQALGHVVPQTRGGSSSRIRALPDRHGRAGDSGYHQLVSR